MYYDRLTKEAVAELRVLSEELAMKALVEVNKRALKLADGDEGKADANQRMTLGFYYYSAGDGKPGDEDR